MKDQIIFWAPQVFSGLAYGSIYGLFGLSIVLLYRANRLINFASTEISTFTVIIMFYLMKYLSYWWAFLFAIGLGFVLGLFLHFFVMRWLLERKNAKKGGQFIITMGFFFIFNSLSAYLFGDEPERFPMPFNEETIRFGWLSVTNQSLFIFAVAVTAVLAVYFFFRLTKLGLLFEAIAEDRNVARLRGIRASYVLAIAWGLTIALGVVTGVAIAPRLFLHPSMLTTILTYSLIGVVIGGLESPVGALMGGMLVGLVENIASNIGYIGSELKFVVVFIGLVLMLLFKPRGFWGYEETRKV